MATLSRLTAFIFAAVLLAGCVAPEPRERDVATEATYLKYSGPPIDSFTYLGHYDGFQILDSTQVVIWTTVNDAYLIEVQDPCYDLRLANEVSLTSTARTVSTNSDYVLVGDERCVIETIRHIDYGAVKRARDAGTS